MREMAKARAEAATFGCYTSIGIGIPCPEPSIVCLPAVCACVVEKGEDACVPHH